jgi:hypothetical protein
LSCPAAWLPALACFAHIYVPRLASANEPVAVVTVLWLLGDEAGPVGGGGVGHWSGSSRLAAVPRTRWPCGPRENCNQSVTRLIPNCVYCMVQWSCGFPERMAAAEPCTVGSDVYDAEKGMPRVAFGGRCQVGPRSSRRKPVTRQSPSVAIEAGVRSPRTSPEAVDSRFALWYNCLTFIQAHIDSFCPP